MKKRKLRVDRLIFLIEGFVVCIALIIGGVKFILDKQQENRTSTVVKFIKEDTTQQLNVDEFIQYINELEANKKDTDNMKYAGEFRLTAYCNCEECNGIWAWGPTYSGTMPEEGRTIATDPDVIPIGTHVIIDDHEYIAEDTGSAIKGNRIDIFVDTHEGCYADWCNGNRDVYILE